MQKGAKQVACFKHAFGSLYLSCLGRETDLCDISIKSSAPARRDLKNLQVLPSLGFYASFRNFKIQFCSESVQWDVTLLWKKSLLVGELGNFSADLAYSKTSWVTWGLFLPKQSYVPLTDSGQNRKIFLARSAEEGTTSFPLIFYKYSVCNVFL